MSFAVKALTRSLNVFHLAGSACNNCDIEILDALTPRYDLERFGIVLVGSYFITSLARINTDLEPLAKLSPLNYYQGGEAIDALNVTWLMGLLVAALSFAVLAWQVFERRDIRVGGEGGWQRPSLSSLSRWLPRRRLAEREVLAAESVTSQR